jgi:hypothetical protein
VRGGGGAGVDGGDDVSNRVIGNGRFRVGERLIITGDDGDTNHDLPAGTEVTAIKDSEDDYGWPSGEVVTIKEVHPSCTSHTAHTHWDVHVDDLGQTLPPVTPEEMREVLASLCGGTVPETVAADTDDEATRTFGRGYAKGAAREREILVAQIAELSTYRRLEHATRDTVINAVITLINERGASHA